MSEGELTEKREGERGLAEDLPVLFFTHRFPVVSSSGWNKREEILVVVRERQGVDESSASLVITYPFVSQPSNQWVKRMEGLKVKGLGLLLDRRH